MDSVQVHSDIGLLRTEWAELADRLRAGPFAHPGWFAAWQSAFGSGTPLVVSVHRRGELAGVLPLRSRYGACASLTNWHTPEFPVLATEEGVLEAMLEEGLRLGHGALDLSFLEADSAKTCSQVAGSRRGSCETRVIQRAPYIDVEGSWQEFLAGLPSRKRSKINRTRKRLETAGEVSFEVLEGSPDLDGALEEGFAIEAAGWKGAAGTAISANPKTLRFYREVARWAAGKGWLRLSFLRVDDRAVAFGFGLEHGGAHYDLKNGFHPDFASYAPGIVLASMRIEQAHESGLDRYEFLGDADRHKLDWTHCLHDRVRAQLFDPTARGLAERLAWRYGRSLRGKAKAASELGLGFLSTTKPKSSAQTELH